MQVLGRPGSQSVAVGTTGHIFEPHVSLRQKAEEKLTLACRSAASAAVFLETDAQNDKQRMVVTGDTDFWKSFDRKFYCDSFISFLGA